jgi:hypothetical protein
MYTKEDFEEYIRSMDHNAQETCRDDWYVSWQEASIAIFAAFEEYMQERAN